MPSSVWPKPRYIRVLHSARFQTTGSAWNPGLLHCCSDVERSRCQLLPTHSWSLSQNSRPSACPVRLFHRPLQHLLDYSGGKGSTDTPQSLRSRPRVQCLTCSSPAAATLTPCIGLNSEKRRFHPHPTPHGLQLLNLGRSQCRVREQHHLTSGVWEEHCHFSFARGFLAHPPSQPCAASQQVRTSFATRVRGLATWRCRSLWISAVHSSTHAWHSRPLAMPEGTIVVLAFVLSCVVNPLVCTRRIVSFLSTLAGAALSIQRDWTSVRKTLFPTRCELVVLTRRSLSGQDLAFSAWLTAVPLRQHPHLALG